VSTIRQIGSKSTFHPHACDLLALDETRLFRRMHAKDFRNPRPMREEEPDRWLLRGHSERPRRRAVDSTMKLRRLMYPSGTSGHTKFGLNDTTRCRGRVGRWSWQVMVASSESRAHDSTLEIRGAYKFTGNFHESFL